MNSNLQVLLNNPSNYFEYDKDQEKFICRNSNNDVIRTFSVNPNHRHVLAYLMYQSSIHQKYCYNPSELNIVLDEFKNYIAINGGIAKKIPYDEWRTLVNWTKDKSGRIYAAFWTDTVDNSTYEVFINTNHPTEPVVIKNIFVFYNTRSKVFTDDYPWDPDNKNEIINVKENNKTMNIPSMNIDFGPVDNRIQMSPCGLAVCNKDGKFLAFDINNTKVVDVTGFTFDFKGMIYKMPVAFKDLREGDMVLHLGKPMVIIEIDEGVINVIDPVASEAKSVLPVTNIFGFNFITKITPLINFNGTTPNPDQPFGNLMPMMMASAFFNKDDDGNGFMNGDIKDLMMFSWVTGGQSPFGNLFNFNVPNPNQ